MHRGILSPRLGPVGSAGTFCRFLSRANGLEIVDVTGSWNPIEHVGFLRHGDGGAVLSNAYSVQVVGNYAYVASLGSRALEIVNVTDPKNPRSVNSKADRDLSTICLKCLEKDPALRYQSARELSIDLRRLSAPPSAISAPPARATWHRRQRTPAARPGRTGCRSPPPACSSRRARSRSSRRC